jgi:hypothetical protein
MIRWLHKPRSQPFKTKTYPVPPLVLLSTVPIQHSVCSILCMYINICVIKKRSPLVAYAEIIIQNRKREGKTGEGKITGGGIGEGRYHIGDGVLEGIYFRLT